MKHLLLVSIISFTVLLPSCNGNFRDGEKIYKNLKQSIANALHEVDANARVTQIISINDIYDNVDRVDSIYISFTDSLNRLDTFRFYYDTNLESFLNELINKTFSFTELRYVESTCVPINKDLENIVERDQFKAKYDGFFFNYSTYQSTALIGNIKCGFSGMSIDKDNIYHSVTNAIYNTKDNTFMDPIEGEFPTLSSTIMEGSNMFLLANYIYKANK